MASPFRLLAVFAFCLLLSPSAFAEYRTYEIESLRILIDSDWPVAGASGYFPVRFDITNLAEAREIEITASGQHWFDPYRHRSRSRSVFGGGLEMGQTDIRQLVRLKRGDRVKFTMNLPVFADNENFSFRLRENGRFVNGFTSHVSFQSGRPMTESPVLVAANSSSSLGLMTAGWLRLMPALRSPGYYIPPGGTSAAQRSSHGLHARSRTPSHQLAGIHLAARGSARAPGMEAA